MTDQSISEAFSNLKESSQLKRLQDAAGVDLDLTGLLESTELEQ